MTIICFELNTRLKKCRDSEAIQEFKSADVALSTIIDFSTSLTFCQF